MRRWKGDVKVPDECETLQDVREAIDELDREVVRLLGRRAGYVHAAGAFKTDEASVRAPDRKRAMLVARRAWAIEEGLDADFVERLYSGVVEHFTGEEWRRVQARGGQADVGQD